MFYTALIFTIILIILTLMVFYNKSPDFKKLRRKTDVEIPVAHVKPVSLKIDIEKRKKMAFLEKLLAGEIEYKFEHVEMFWKTRDEDFERLMERILEKYDIPKALKFLELRVELVDRAAEEVLNKLQKKENINSHIDSIEENLEVRKHISKSISADEIIIESNSKELIPAYSGVVHPVVYGFLNGNSALKEYCTSVMPFIDVPFKNNLLLGRFMDTNEKHVARYNSMIALLKVKTDKESIFKILHSYCSDDFVDKDSKAIAVRAMGQISSEDVKKNLFNILRNAEIELKIAAALALGNFCEEDVAEKLLDSTEINEDDLTEAVAVSLGKMSSIDVTSKIEKKFINLDNKIKKTAMKLTQKLSLKKLTPYVKKLLTNPDLDLRMMAGNFILDNESAGDIELLLDYFKEIDDYLLGKAKDIKLSENAIIEDIITNERRAFYFTNNMDSFLDEDELISNSVEAFKTSSKYVKATCVLKLIDCAEPKGKELIKTALNDKDYYLVEAAINAITKRKSNDMDYLLVEKLGNVSIHNIINLLNGIIIKKLVVEEGLLKKFFKTDNEYVKVLISTIRRQNTI